MSKGIAPTVTGFGLQEGLWLQGLAGGTNQAYQNGITAHAGGTQALAFQLPPLVSMFSIDISGVGGTDSVMLPAAVPGTFISVNNNTVNTVDLYAYIGVNNGVTAGDKINANANGTAYALTANTPYLFQCAKAGQWGAK